MATNKVIVCLANSRKNGGHCVAGKEVLTDDAPGGWVRPVSARPTRELTWAERAYTGMVDPAILDLILVPLSAPSPEGHQVENHLIAKGERWQKAGILAPASLQKFVDSPGQLWLDGYSSSAGKNDRVPAAEAGAMRGSLVLLRPPELLMRVGVPAMTHGIAKRKVYAVFGLGNTEYALPMTDPQVEKEFLARNNGDYPVSGAYLTVSLSEPFEGHCYKLAAALIMP